MFNKIFMNNSVGICSLSRSSKALQLTFLPEIQILHAMFRDAKEVRSGQAEKSQT